MKAFAKLTKTAAAVLTALTIAAACVIPAFAAENRTSAVAEDCAVEFKSIDEVDAAIQAIYADNEEEILRMAMSLSILKVEPRYFAYYFGSCGPVSKAFQKVLADNHIYVEERKAKINTEVHAYNLLRVSFDGGDTVTSIIIDPTYKQTMRDYFQKSLNLTTDSQIDEAILAADLPKVNVFAFGKGEQYDAKINGYLEKLGMPRFDIEKTMGYYEPTAYPEYELQMTYNTFLTEEQIEKIHNAGKLNKPLDGDLFFNGENGENLPFHYSENGIYSCLVSGDAFSTTDDLTFTVCDDGGSAVFGASDENVLTGYYSYQFGLITGRKQQSLLQKGSALPVKINLRGTQNMLVRIDMRAGADNPIICLIPVETICTGGETRYSFQLDYNSLPHVV